MCDAIELNDEDRNSERFLYTFSDGLVDANTMLHAEFTRCTFTIFHADNEISLYIYFDLLISCIFRFSGITY